MSHEAQTQRMIRAMKQKKVKSYEFMRDMYITSPHRRMTDIRNKGVEIQQEFVYDKEGRNTRVKQYWIKRRPRGQKRPEQAMEYEETPRSNFFIDKINKLKGVM